MEVKCLAFFKNRPLVITIIAILILIILVFATSGERELSPVESAVGTAIQPVESVTSSATGGIVGFFERVFRTTPADRENEQLKERIAQLESDVSMMEDVRKENERLQQLLNFQATMPELLYTTTRVIAKDPGYWFDVFVIGAGRSVGIEKGQCVINSQGLVGIVFEVGGTWSKVMSIIDARSSIPGIVERTRDNGMVRGSLETGEESGVCQMFYLPFENDLVPGDRVLTSGLGEGVPKGLLIGEVSEVSRERDEKQRNAIIKPAVDFVHLEEVMVVRMSTPSSATTTPAPTAEPAAPTPQNLPSPSNSAPPPAPDDQGEPDPASPSPGGQDALPIPE